MKFSVVIPLYNKAAYIMPTLTSLFAQTVQDYEVIVVDDGSRDGGAELIESTFPDPRLRVVRQANAGVSAARNRGIDLAQGEWVAFLDADDCWHPHYLESLQSVMARCPTVDVVAARLRFVEDGPDWTPEPWPHYDPAVEPVLIPDLHARWMQGIPFSTSAVAVRARLLKGMQPCFRPGESNGEDLDLWFRLSEVSDIAWMPQYLMAYRSATPGSLTSGHTQLQEPPYIGRMLARVRDGSMPVHRHASARKFIADQRLTLARNALMRGLRREAFGWILRSQGQWVTKRWYVTIMMAAFMPSAWIQRWEQWRVARAQQRPVGAQEESVA